ncbi:hypothetical protein P3T76_016155 [Phytophthora citrophthora]|uniref:Uncharacterized protein n=1 Tax=Phytophthora citrophthora TaxID=4793 RepID=A0AAD9FY30_9STRA|nr:hypothetical protein P3T76_016155 [Phytophthora citrophthora]
MGFAYFLTPKSMTLSWDANDKAETMNQFRDFISLYYSDDVKTREYYAELSRYILLEIHKSPDLFNIFTNLRGLEYWIQYGRSDFPYWQTSQSKT